jgi:hypothetical protein
MKPELFDQRLRELAVVRPINNKNPTEGVEIRHVKQSKTSCGDCGKQVVDRRIWNRVLWTPERHWRKTCSACNLTQHPVTRQYTVSNNTVLMVYRDYLANSNNTAK